jgi:mono/diheme cytochrome c family protein
MAHPIIKISLRLIPAVLLAFTLIPAGCYYDNEEELYPNTSCDTTNVTYSADVWPVINDNCVSCHSGGAPSGNISLENYDNIKNQALISSGQPGSLYGAISHDPGNSPMPKSGGKLSDCAITKIKKWIDDGALNN